MRTLIAVVSFVAAGAFLAGCPSKDSGASSGATTPSSVTASASSSAAPPASGSASGSGPLAGLESKPPATESWTTPDGQPLPMLYWSDLNVRVSASCKQADGSLSCAALNQLRNGPQVQVSSKGMRPGISMGTKACLKLGYKLVHGKNPAGAEDGFCTFPDGSMVSVGALEQYGVNTTSN